MPTAAPVRLVLASGSPARLRLLQAAGVDPTVVISHAPEDDVDPRDPAAMVAALARRKAEVVAAHRPAGASDTDPGFDGTPGELILGCDSTLDVDGVAHGKPGSDAEAVARWHRLRGREATLLTGHHLIGPGGAWRAATARTVVRFGTPSDAEVDAYVATGEPLGVAGAFTLDGRSAPFVEGIDGDPSNVIGLSLPLLRRLVGELGVEWTTLWA